MEAEGSRGSGSSAPVLGFFPFFSSASGMPVRLVLVMDNEGVYMTNGKMALYGNRGCGAKNML